MNEGSISFELTEPSNLPGEEDGTCAVSLNVERVSVPIRIQLQTMPLGQQLRPPSGVPMRLVHCKTGSVIGAVTSDSNGVGLFNRSAGILVHEIYRVEIPDTPNVSACATLHPPHHPLPASLSPSCLSHPRSPSIPPISTGA